MRWDAIWMILMRWNANQKKSNVKNFAALCTRQLSSNVSREIAYDSILVLVNRYTKYARYVRARQNWIAVQLADAMIKELFIKYEISEVIITDRENFFISKY
jgi:hypothetical protein